MGLDHRQATTNINPIHQNHQQWPVPSKPHASPPVARLPVSNLLPRLPASLHHQPEVSRSPTDTSQACYHSIKGHPTRQTSPWRAFLDVPGVTILPFLRHDILRPCSPVC